MYSSKMFLPDLKLKEWIKVYWFLEGNGKGKNHFHKIFIPDGCATIFMVFNGTINFSEGNEYIDSRLNKGIYIVPPICSSYKVAMSDDIKVIDIQLKPSIFFKLFKFPVINFSNKLYTFNDLSLKFDKSILEKLYEKKDNNIKLYNELNNFFIDLFNKKNFYADEIIYNISQLYKVGNLDNFFSEQNLSIRQLERKVKNYTGLTPKNISRIARFYSILEQMKFRQFNIEFSELAFEYNFSDQSHFIREFRHFTNDTPNRFVKGSNNFPQFKGLCNLTKIT